MKHILVTGGAGFIGSHTVDLLLRRGYQVRVLDNLSPPVHRSGQIPDYFSEQAEFMAGDVRNKADWERALESIDAVYHFAAYQDYLPDFSKFFHINTVGPALLYEVIVEHGFPIQKVVVASSQAVYGEGKYHCAADGVQYPSPRPTEQLEQEHARDDCILTWSPLRYSIRRVALFNCAGSPPIISECLFWCAAHFRDAAACC